jgi:preprotein translocase subunit SecY
LVVVVIVLAMTAFIVWITQAQRRITIQTPKKIVGRKVYGGQSNFLPLRVNTAGVIPVIFASSIMMVPGTAVTYFHNSDIMQTVAVWFSPGSIVYSFLYALLIIFFTYFYTAIIFNPVDIADNLKKSGGFIPGIRPGQKTSEFLDNVLTRITLPGAFFLAFVSVVPFLMMGSLNVQFYFGGTSVLIVIGVALDTVQQLESHLMMRHYDGFSKKGRIRGRMR